MDLSVPALVVLISLKGLPFFGSHHAARTAAPVDTLPPPWRPVSRLALENDFVLAALPEIVRAHGGMKLSSDPRTLQVTVDADSGLISADALVGTVPVGPPVRLTLDSYANNLTRLNFQRDWQQRSIDAINSRVNLDGSTSTGTGGLSFKLPSPLPRRVQSLLGPGGPAINVAGSENIRLSGTSNWTNQQVGALGTKRSLFPSLDMQQDLNIKLEGQLSDRIKVNLLQNSANQIPLANRIFINYKGDEDDLVQELDLGNTSLSLPGTQYVSYSGKNDGLFGVKTALRLGPADFTVLASKQEGRSERASYTGGSARQVQTINDLDYVKGVYFMLFDPDSLPSWLPPDVAASDAFQKGGGISIPDNTIHLYLDDGNPYNDINTFRGKALKAPERRGCDPFDTTAVRGSFALLQPGADKDYEILQNVYGPYFKVIRLKKQVSLDQVLAVSYQAQAVDANGRALTPLVQIGGQIETDSIGCTVGPDSASTLRLKLVRPPDRSLKANDLGNFDTTDVITQVRELELRNFYQLPGQQIDATSFSLSIRRGYDQPPIVAIPKPGVSIPYIEVLGLDSQDETSGRPVPGHDGRVDGSIPFSNSRVLVDYANGILFFPDPRPFAPRIAGPFARPFEKAVSDNILRRETLTGPPDSLNAPNPLVYDKYLVRTDTDKRYFMDVSFSAARAVGDIQLGRGNILEGSEVVTINGEQLVRDRDYSIDYDIGKVTLKRQLGPTDQLNVNYSYAPLFAQAGRTLIGSDFRLEGREKRFGAALLYESRGAQDLRPRIGEEPSRNLIGDVNTEWTFHPDWVTRMVDHLPGIRTTTPSDFHFQAEMGASFPNPNTKGIVYLDDMESARDAVSLAMSAERWKHSSVPSLRTGGDVNGVSGQHNTEVDWYSPPNSVKEHDLNPTLNDAEGGSNSRQVLAISLPRRPTSPPIADSDSLWAGLTYALDPVGLDLTRSQFIEIWVNDFNDHHLPAFPEPRVRGRHVRLHIDVGAVSEDQQRSPDVFPNHLLDTEDTSPPDNQLQVSDDNHNEDTGLDGRPDPAGHGAGAPEDTVRDLVTASAADPEGDDFQKVHEEFKDQIDTRRFRGTNGTEGNHNLLPIPDTEDLNANNHLDTNEDYFEYTIDLGDDSSAYLRATAGGIDVRRDYGGKFPAIANDLLNGWRRYRIPINDSLRTQIGLPNLALARTVRIWVDHVKMTDPPDPAFGVPDSLGGGPVRPFLMLGGFDIVGSRWQTAQIDTAGTLAGTTLTLNTVNNIDDSGIYSAPFNPGDALNGNRTATRREQSLSLEFERLLPGEALEAFKTFSLDEDYSRYGSLTFYAEPYGITSDFDAARDTLSYFVRFASDEVGGSYYEFRHRITPTDVGRFQSIEIPLTMLSNLKLRPDFPTLDPIHYVAAGPNPGDSLVVNGRPSFTRLRRISVGLLNGSKARRIEGGQLWFDELRAIHVAKDVGTAKRIEADGKFANLLHYTLNYNDRDANFVTVGETRGSGSSQSQIDLNGGLDLNRFFEGTGILLPVNASWTRGISKPRFTAGDDVVRTGALQNASETRNEGRSISASYSRSWSDRANPFLRYTLGGITANTLYSTSDGRDPTSFSNGTTRSSNVSYTIAPRNLLRVPVPGTKFGIYPLPERFFWNYTVTSQQGRTLDRQRDGSVIPRSSISSSAASISFGADTRPIDLLHHHFDAVRNLRLPDPLMEHIGFVNLGRVTQWRQSFDSRYVLNRGPWLSPGLSWNSSYTQDNRPDLSPDLSIRQISNGQTVGLNWTLPFDRLATPRRAPGDTTKTRSGGALSFAKNTLARLGSISADASLTQSSSYSRVTGTPSALYLTGLDTTPGFSSQPGHGVQAAFGNGSAVGTDFRTSGRGRIALGFDAFVSTRAEYDVRSTNANSVSDRAISTRYPDLDIEYGRISQLIGLNRLMQSPQLRTSYTRSVETDYHGGDANPITRSASSQWQPLLGLSGMTKSQTRVEMRIERRVSVRENFQLTTSTTTDRNTDINLNLSRAYSKGQKVTFLGKQTTVKSNVNLQLALAYSKQSGETRQLGQSQPQLPTNRDRLSVNGSGSYSFSNNVTGNVALGFGQNRDIVRDITSRDLRLELRASFTF